MTQTFPPPRVLLILAAALLSALSWGVLQVFGDDGEDDDAPPNASAEAVALLTLQPDEGVENLFRVMGRVADAAGPCDTAARQPLLSAPLPEPGTWACVRVVNGGPRTALWRVDFEGSFGAGYRFETVSDDQRALVLFTPPSVAWRGPAPTIEGRRVASRVIAIASGAHVDLFVQVAEPADLRDADPVFVPEGDFDHARQTEAHGFGALIGAAAVLLCVLLALSRLVSSGSAGRFALYFAAAMLAAITNAGYLNGFVPGNPLLPVGLANKALEAVQVAAHLLFMAAFVREGLPDSRLPAWLTRSGLAALVLLGLAALLSLFVGGASGALLYLDLGFELDPLAENPTGALPSFLGALVTASWIGAIVLTSTMLLRRKADGGGLFAFGGGILVLGLLAASLGDDSIGLFDDTTFGLSFVLLGDAVIFTAALARQAFGLRDQRDQAVRKELQATREKMEMAQTLLQARKDTERSKALAEAHRNRLALTGHDLRQPLTSLHLALSEAERTNPALGDTLRSSLDYIRSVLDATVTDTRPEELAEDEGAYHTEPEPTEVVPVDLLLSNAVRMFAQEASSRGLELQSEPTDLQVRTVPVTVIRILSNLVSNAVKYTAEGSVTLRAARDGESVSIQVIDTGRGMDAAEVARIQQSYVRGSEAGAADGDGLGLSSAAEFAASIGARLTIQSTPGEGSCFAVEGLALEAHPD